MNRATQLLTAAAFASAAGGAVATAYFGALFIEQQSSDAVIEILENNGIDWAELYADGLRLEMSGTAPTEAARFRAITLAGNVVDARRLIDQMDIADTDNTAPPRFSLEILRNDAGISLIGLIPSEGSEELLATELRSFASQTTDMVETADHPTPEGWEQKLRFALQALEDLQRAKISIDEDRVMITAVTDSQKEKSEIESKLTRRKPADLRLALDINAPRPVLTPFSLRLVKSEDGTLRFNSCSADSEDARRKIIAAASAAGFTGKSNCVIGLGVPSKTWGDAGATAIAALSELPAGTLTFSDADVTLEAINTTPRDVFDRVASRLDSALPDVFSLNAILPDPPVAEGQEEQPEFLTTLSPEGIVQMRGSVRDSLQETAVLAVARAHFGVRDTFISVEQEDALSSDWSTRVFAGLEALSHLHNGALSVSADVVEVRGVSGEEDATGTVTRILSDKLNRSQRFIVNVRYDESLDPSAGLPTAAECIARMNNILSEKKITFASGSERFQSESLEKIRELSEAFEGCETINVEIGGHTDSQGGEDMNRSLSQRRADAVRNALIDRGVSPAQMTAVGYGETQPIASNDTADGREANRRIAFKLIKPAETAEETVAQ